jgi:hypothetical protein
MSGWAGFPKAMVRGARKPSRKTGVPLNKGMPTYDQMSGLVVEPGHGPTKDPGISAFCSGSMLC